MGYRSPRSHIERSNSDFPREKEGSKESKTSDASVSVGFPDSSTNDQLATQRKKGCDPKSPKVESLSGALGARGRTPRAIRDESGREEGQSKEDAPGHADLDPRQGLSWPNCRFHCWAALVERDFRAVVMSL